MGAVLVLLIGLIAGYFVWCKYTRQWQEVLITEDVNHFMQVCGQLEASKIKYKSTTGGQEFNFRRSKGKSNLPSVTYSILVSEEQVPSAQRIITTMHKS